MDETVLNYKGIVLRRSDICILGNGSYFNDRIIEFYFRYLANIFNTEEILLIPPSVSSSLAEPSDTNSLNEAVEPLKLEHRKLILFPVKDNDGTDNDEDGSHWSLLVYCRTIHLFFHHDSLGGINHVRARKLYENVKNLVGYGGKGKQLRKSSGKNKRRRAEACFFESFTPVEAYGYDSGPYVLLTADTACRWLMSWPTRHSRFWFPALEKRVGNSYVQLNMRNDVLALIDSLKKEGGGSC